jgi:hypothetical protein
MRHKLMKRYKQVNGFHEVMQSTGVLSRLSAIHAVWFLGVFRTISLRGHPLCMYQAERGI